MVGLLSVQSHAINALVQLQVSFLENVDPADVEVKRELEFFQEKSQTLTEWLEAHD